MKTPINESEWDGILRGSDAKRFMKLLNGAKPISDKERKRIREHYEAMAKIVKT